MADLLDLLDQPGTGEVHLAMVPQADGGVVAQGMIVHPAPTPVVAVVEGEEG